MTDQYTYEVKETKVPNVQEYDLVVVGSGSAGFAAAIRATGLGLRVAMAEAGTVGGTCVNTGCVPSKALLAAAAARHSAKDAGRFPGLEPAKVGLDVPELMAGKDALVGWMRQQKYLDLADDYGWDIHRGRASFVGSPEEPVLEVAGDDGGAPVLLRGRHYLVATGSAPWVPELPGLAETGYLTSQTAMELAGVPESLLVVGGGYVAVEQAQLFARLGSRVTVLARSRLLSAEEPEVSMALASVFHDEGIRVVRRAVPTGVRTDPSTGEAVVTGDVGGTKEEYRAERVLMATGRRPRTAGLGLAGVGVATGPAGEVLVDAGLRSANPRIWAAGDVTGHREFVNVAAAHGALAVENAFASAGLEVDYSQLPRVAFTSPAVGAVGLTDRQANAGHLCECRVLPLEFVPRALVNRDTRGFIKIVAEEGTGRILGITAVAQDAGELAAAGVHLIASGTTVAELAARWAPYLTMAEGLKIAAQSYTADVSRLSCCAV
ncbi:mercury(II) reductase [Sinomonas albida]|uniref:mercury(II) reductase n=1 Tax=Sinomonas albida TaxID=369942 RepID=UPI001F2F2C69|nr:mercury(II) reductase [Sinomonas albida]